MVEVFDFPGVDSQGRTSNAARRMIRDALRSVVEWLMEDSKPFDSPQPRARDKTAEFEETILLNIRVRHYGGAAAVVW